LELRGGAVLTHGRLRRLGSATMGVTVLADPRLQRHQKVAPVATQDDTPVLPAGRHRLEPQGIQRGLSEFGYCFNLFVCGVIRS
jgi:hypothetical protein